MICIKYFKFQNDLFWYSHNNKTHCINLNSKTQISYCLSSRGIKCHNYWLWNTKLKKIQKLPKRLVSLILLHKLSGSVIDLSDDGIEAIKAKLYWFYFKFPARLLISVACMCYYPIDVADLIIKDYLIIYTPCLPNQIIEEPLMEVLFKELECRLTKLLQAFTFFQVRSFHWEYTNDLQ